MMSNTSPSFISVNYFEKSILSILNHISQNNKELIDQLYNLASTTFKNKPHFERLYHKIRLRMAKKLFDSKQYDEVQEIIDSQKESMCDFQDTHILDLYALEIQLADISKEDFKIRSLYEKAMTIRSTIQHPIVMATIYDYGGRLHLRTSNYERGYNDMFEAFKQYDEAGSAKRIKSLRYIILTNMMIDCSIDPFDSPETAPYKNNQDVKSYYSLYKAYKTKDLTKFQQLIRLEEFQDEDLTLQMIDKLKLRLKLSKLLEVIRPFERVSLESLAKMIDNTSIEEIEILLALLNDENVCGMIDDDQKVFVKSKMVSEWDRSVNAWIGDILKICETTNHFSSFRTREKSS